jgi:hypothetical protein
MELENIKRIPRKLKKKIVKCLIKLGYNSNNYTVIKITKKGFAAYPTNNAYFE